MQQSSTPTASQSPARRTRSDRTARAPGLLRDQRGITTAEYAMVFVVVAVGSLATWKSLANKVTNQVSTGTDTFNTVLLQHMGDATKGKGDGHADALGVGAFKQPEGHVGGGGVGKTDERHMDGPAANGGAAMYKGDERGGQVQGAGAPVHKGDQRAEQQAPADIRKGDQRADPMQAAQAPADIHKGDQRADQQADQAPADIRKGDQRADPMQAAQAPAEGLHKQDQTLAQDATQSAPTNKHDSEPHYSTNTGTNKQDQTKMDPAGVTRKGDTRTVDQSNTKPRKDTPVKGGR